VSRDALGMCGVTFSLTPYPRLLSLCTFLSLTFYLARNTGVWLPQSISEAGTVRRRFRTRGNESILKNPGRAVGLGTAPLTASSAGNTDGVADA
jgi:hypothetical protein